MTQMEAGVSILTMICQQMEATYGWVEEVEAPLGKD